MRYPKTALLAVALLAACTQSKPTSVEPVILDCELTGTNSSRDFIRPSNGLAPTTASEKMAVRVTETPFKLESWSDEKNAFVPMCAEGLTCNFLQSDAEYRFSSTLHMEDKAGGWVSDEQSKVTISRTSGAIASLTQMTVKSNVSHLVMTKERSGTCKRGTVPSQKF